MNSKNHYWKCATQWLVCCRKSPKFLLIPLSDFCDPFLFYLILGPSTFYSWWKFLPYNSLNKTQLKTFPAISLIHYFVAQKKWWPLEKATEGNQEPPYVSEVWLEANLEACQLTNRCSRKLLINFHLDLDIIKQTVKG